MVCICRIMLVLVLIMVASGLDNTKTHHTPKNAPTMVFVGWAFEPSRANEEEE